ncbi:ABC transporter substrate-binding protein [Bacillus sp. FJAT-28004]|uniref:ABC transporter substrate-binding protein n=1 Tax=Bacillus sp. FJAT-28004 TaxID=1679165 RepID=UPI0006B5F2AE|nr:ABC transporter substrate-binding protein [Bacillus sp. FJAT-28004]
MLNMSPTACEEMSLTPHLFYMPVRITRLDTELLDSSYEEAKSLPRILIVWSGEALLYINDQQYEISRGSVVLCDSGQRLKLKPSTSLRGIQITYRCLTADGSEQRGLFHPEPLHRCLVGILRLAGELEKVWREPQLSGPFRTQQLWIELLEELYQELSAMKQPSIYWLEQTLHYMETHYNKDLTREQMAEQANVSQEHFSRTFRKNTGRTFNAYLTLLRIRSAQRRILVGAPDLNTLAQEVGYKEGLYLSRKFKEAVGLSPTAYQRKHKRIAALNLNHTASLMALGIIPELGVYTSWLEYSSKKLLVDTSQKFNPYGQTPSTYYEAIAAARPDVIISYSAAEVNKSLLPLAPVLELPFMTMNWREQFLMIADIVDRRQKAEAWLAYYDQLIIRSNHRLDRELGCRGTAIVWEIDTSKAYCCSSSYGRGCQILYDDLGFRPPSELLEQGISTRGYVEVDIEAIASYPADHIFITALPSYPGDQRHVDRLFRSPRWQELKAVRHKQVYLLNQPEMFCGYDPISSQAQLRELLRALTSRHK